MATAFRKFLRRYGGLFLVQLRTSTMLAMQYRFDFVLKSAMSFFWLLVTLVPLVAVFHQRPNIVGWTLPEALVVIGWFVFLKGILEGGVTPSLATVVEGIRDGRFDFILIKPADAQFLVSTARFEPWRCIDFFGALLIFVYAFHQMGRWPALHELVVAFVLLLMAVALLYSLWILVVSASFWVVRVDNLGYLLSSVFDAARWPVTVFQGALRFIFTVVFPLALMTTYPSLALLGKLDWQTALYCLLGGLGFVVLARLVWLHALRAYTSASS